MNNKMDSSLTPMSVSVEGCVEQNRCHISTPAPSTPFPYSPLTPYATHPYSYLNRYSTSSAAHIQSAYNSPLNNFASLAYPHDIFHYNPYNALTPTPSLTPSSFWSLTAQQSYHQLSGLTFGPSSMSYNTNAHLYNLFSPNSLSPMSPNQDLHSPSLYPRVSSLPTPYASSPGLSSAFMSPSSMPLLLSPSIASSVDRPPTYLSDNTSTPSTTPSMTPIKCEPGELNCHSHQSNHSNIYFSDNISKNNIEERNIERIDNNIVNNEHNVHKHKSKHDNKSLKHKVIEPKHQIQQEPQQQKTITTTITSIPTKSKEKYSARVEPLVRIQETIETVVRNGNDIKCRENGDINNDYDSNRSNANNNNNSCETTVNTRNESPIKNCIKDNNNLDLNLMNANIKREMIECDMSLPLNSVNSVPNNSINDNAINNNELNTNSNSIDVKIDNNVNKNLVIDDNCVKSSDGKEVLIFNNNNDINKREKDAKRESQLKQLQSYRKESHRMSNKSVADEDGVQPIAAISIVLPKPKDQTICEQQKPFATTPVTQSSLKNESLMSSMSSLATKQVPVVEPHKQSNPKTQSVSPVRTKPKITNNVNTNISTNAKSALNTRKLDNISVNTNGNQIIANTQKLAQNNNIANKPLPKKPRMSRKHTSAAIPVGIAIAQQRTSPKTKLPNDMSISATSASQSLKPILPTLSLPMVANSPILITDSPPAGTSLWIKPTNNSTLTNNNALQTGSQFSITGDYQLARDSLTGQLYLIRNSSSLPTTPTATKTPTLIPSITLKASEHQQKSSPSTIITLPVGAAQSQQFFASLAPTQTSTLILDTTNTTPLVRIASTASVTSVMPNLTTNNTTTFTNNSGFRIGQHLEIKNIKDNNNININNNVTNVMSNVERGTQASISDDEAFNYENNNMKTTATQVDMDHIHSSEEDDDNDGKRHKVKLIEDRKQTTERKASLDGDEESSRDSIQLQIVDDRCEAEDMSAPVLPVKSAPVMEFIDHHGLDLLVDSIEEFAAREEVESNSSTAEPVDGLQLLSALAEQRSLEERAGHGSPPRRHSADCNINTNSGHKNSLSNELSAMKRKQRSESCFTSSPLVCDENEELFSDIKKLMKTSSCQTEIFDRRRRHLIRCDDELNSNSFVNLRRSERIFIHDSVVVNSKDAKDVNIDVNKDKDVLNIKELKKKDSDIKLKVLKSNTTINKVIDKNVTNEELKEIAIKPKDNNLVKNKVVNNEVIMKSSDELSTPSIPVINKNKIDDKVILSEKQKTISDSINATKDKIIKKEKKKKLSSLPESFSASLSSNNTCDSSDDKKMKKRKKKQKQTEEIAIKKLKTDSEKQMDENIDNIIKFVSEKVIKEDINIINETTSSLSDEKVEKTDNNSDDKSETVTKKRKQVIRPPFELYDEKRMKLLDETIDEIIAKPWIPLETDDISQETPIPSVIEPELTSVSMQSSPQPLTPSKPMDSSPEPQKHVLIKQSSISSTSSSDSSTIISLRLTESDLDMKMNVIMLVDGLLFVGEICPIQAPDIYGIILHGERQHRPHIYSQEEMLREAIREVKPSLDVLDEGQRVCAYWSTQYRHLYPGYVRSSSPHPNLVFVEFDDGDNGRISIDDIRLLPQDYPQMKINADPLKNLERRRRMSSCGRDSRTSKQNLDINNDHKVEDIEDNKKSMDENTSLATVSKSIIDNKPNDETNKESNIESNKKLNVLSLKANKSCNTSSDKVCETAESSNGMLSLKLDVRLKKKKKHTKDDRHHRHHHNHKHHHCRHHRKCKKHKKSKEDNNNGMSSSSSSISISSVCKEKSTKLIASRVGSKEVQKKDSDAQKVSNYLNNNKDKEETKNSKSVIHQETDKFELKTIIRKKPKRASDKSLTNKETNDCSTTNLSISHRKRHAIDTKDDNNVKNNNESVNNKTTLTPKKRERMPSSEKSKIAPFLPERQIWHWSGKSIRRTGNKGSRTRKVYYKEIERGREHIRVDDCAVFLSTGRPHLPYIGRIDSMWQTGSGTMIVKVRWFYHPEETKGDSVPLIDKRGALFESTHFDVNDVQTISHKCQVISWIDYQQKRRETPSIVSDDPPNVYYLAGHYEALSGRVDMDSSVPLKDKSKEV